MASTALDSWSTELSAQLDELEAVHQAATGSAPGRRWGTEQLNGSLYVALVGAFQAFARSLHDDALRWLGAQGPIAAQLEVLALANRQLDRGNPSRSTLASDFGRLGMTLLDDLKRRPHGPARLDRLDAALAMRNGTAHRDQAQRELAEALGAQATLSSYRRHRKAFSGLAVDMEGVVAHYLHDLTGKPTPW